MNTIEKLSTLLIDAEETFLALLKIAEIKETDVAPVLSLMRVLIKESKKETFSFPEHKKAAFQPYWVKAYKYAEGFNSTAHSERELEKQIALYQMAFIVYIFLNMTEDESPEEKLSKNMDFKESLVGIENEIRERAEKEKKFKQFWSPKAQLKNLKKSLSKIVPTKIEINIIHSENEAEPSNREVRETPAEN